jgi:hypothetical protein
MRYLHHKSNAAEAALLDGAFAVADPAGEPERSDDVREAVLAGEPRRRVVHAR